mmetsp:Transcript_15485/g.30425  ORF Transcript_15485/g.30425 Transcript_15485/m.30425 type:complete len:128 (+) Transcript_15485:1-384(+)
MTGPFTKLFLTGYVAVHSKLIYTIFVQRPVASAFGKYAIGYETTDKRSTSDQQAHTIAVAERVYWAKSAMFLLMVLLQANGVPFQPALAVSFCCYAAAMFLLLPRTHSTLLYCLGGAGLLAEMMLSS